VLAQDTFQYADAITEPVGILFGMLQGIPQ
jgi:hypothetical protein